MRLSLPAIALLALAPLALAAPKGGGTGKIYKWIDENGQVHYGDSIPARYADQEKERVDEHGIAREIIAGKKTAEELEAERRAEEERLAAEAEHRANQALLVTYSTVPEIEMHRDRRVELFKAQARVTELYLSNQRRQLQIMRSEAGRYKPYSSDPNAPQIPQKLVGEIEETEDLIERHESNLNRYRDEEKRIYEQFERDIARFKKLKGIGQESNITTMTAAQAGGQSVPE